MSYLRPKTRGKDFSKRSMEEGLARNPPTYMPFGGFTSSEKWTSPTGKRLGINGPSLERGGPSAQKGKPV